MPAPHITPDRLTSNLFALVVAGTVAFLAAVAVVLW